MALYNNRGYPAWWTLLDSEDLGRVQEMGRWGFTSRPDRRWGPYVLRHGAGKSKGGRKPVYLHRFLMEPIPEGMWVDHVSGNTLDNRKVNLQICRPEENIWNQRQQVGILLIEGRYRAQISRKFDTYEEAVEQRIIWEEGRI